MFVVVAVDDDIWKEEKQHEQHSKRPKQMKTNSSAKMAEIFAALRENVYTQVLIIHTYYQRKTIHFCLYVYIHKRATHTHTSLFCSVASH